MAAQCRRILQVGRVFNVCGIEFCVFSRIWGFHNKQETDMQDRLQKQLVEQVQYSLPDRNARSCQTEFFSKRNRL
jgi:hypothetical protein